MGMTPQQPTEPEAKQLAEEQPAKPAAKPAPIVIGVNLIVAKTSMTTPGGSSDGSR